MYESVRIFYGFQANEYNYVVPTSSLSHRGKKEKMVTLYLNQDYHKLKQECQHQGKKFIDPDFPPDGHSLGMTNEAVIWKRPEV